MILIISRKHLNSMDGIICSSQHIVIFRHTETEKVLNIKHLLFYIETCREWNWKTWYSLIAGFKPVLMYSDNLQLVIIIQDTGCVLLNCHWRSCLSSVVLGRMFLLCVVVCIVTESEHLRFISFLGTSSFSLWKVDQAHTHRCLPSTLSLLLRHHINMNYNVLGKISASLPKDVKLESDSLCILTCSKELKMGISG